MAYTSSFKFSFADISLQSLCLFVLLALYGVASSPTPDDPGLIELIIAGLLILIVSRKFYLIALPTYWKSHIIIFGYLVFGLTLPLIIGLLNTSDPDIIFRDIVAFLLLLLPFFLYPVIGKSKEQFGIFFFGIIFIAVCFAFRVAFTSMPFLPQTGELLYLANSPLVLFTAIFSIGCVYTLLPKFYIVKNSLLICTYFSICTLMLIAMFDDVQRATIMAAGISLLAFVVFSLIYHPKKACIPIIFISLIVILLWQNISSVFDAITIKTSLVGVNSRVLELGAVWNEIGQTPLKAIFGLGWGAQFESPALGGLQASFTHSLLSYMLLKTGLFGLFITLAYLGHFGVKLIQILQCDRVVGIALFWSFVIPVFLYASYKSFDFGLILTLISIYTLYGKKIDPYYQSRLPVS